ncbi:MAG: HlyD family efflux transporter periplasmic adaptor subunit [Lachnospiraceae bacterium]|nr:HlyD family efflux transporter periplasmic adaptor subunit [Lachnospiraceae bacterium]
MEKNKKIWIGAGCSIAILGIAATIGVLIWKNGQTSEVTYRETTVEYGNLTVGITEDSTVNIGTVSQTFDLDISALVSSDSSSSSSTSQNDSMGGMGMQMFSFGGDTYTSQSQEMVIDSVHITVGQEIQAGDVLYTLTEDSVEEIRTQLEEDVEDTLADYQALTVEQQQSYLTAKQGYDTYVTNGSLAELTYNKKLQDLQDKVDEAADTLEEKQNQVNENLEKLVELQEELTSAKKDLKDAEAAVSENHDNRYNDPYYYTVYLNTRDMAQTIVDEIEDDIESLTDENETLLTEIGEATRSWNEACRNLESEKLTAQQTLETDQYYASVSSEWYSIQTTSLDNEKQSAYASYESAVKKLDEFNSYIVGNDVIAEDSGVVTEVPLEEGDGVTRNTSLVTLYDASDVTMEITVSEDGYKAIDQDGEVNITYTAYPDVVYSGIISEVSDAAYDSSSGEVYYTITVTVQGDVSGLYEGMTGDVTCVTKETKEVTYVSNRAIFRDGTRSYVKVRDENGSIVEKDVTTGFSDGVNVEITEGLSQGDTVLIESKVSES